MQEREKKSLGALVSQLVAEALARRTRTREKARDFRWVSRAMGARIDITDKDALYAALDESTE